MSTKKQRRLVRESLETIVDGLEDPRVQRRCTYSLVQILGISFIGILCGKSDIDEIVDYATYRKKFVKMLFPTIKRIPDARTFVRVLDVLDPSVTTDKFFQFL